MDNEKIYTKFSEIENQLKKNASKHAKLQDINHKEIVPYNPPSIKVVSKIAEIKRKLENLPDGVYCIVAQDRFGKNVHQDNFYFGKGKYNKEVVTPVIQFHENGNNNSNSENLLSLESAVENIKESSNLKAENLFLKKENDELKKKVLELEQEVELLENVEAMNEEQPNSLLAGLKPFLSEFAPMLPSIADNYFRQQKDNNDLAKTKLLLEHGYEIPGLQKKSSDNGAKRQKMPQPGTPEWDQYIAEVSELPDDQFEAHLSLIERKFPELYPHLIAEVIEEEPEQE